MARVVLPVTTLTPDTGVNIASTFVTGDATNHHYIAGGSSSENMILLIKNSNAGAQTLTLKAGDGGEFGPAWRSMMGDLTISVPATTGQYAFFLTDTARFRQSDGTIEINVSHANITVSVLGVN